MFSSEGHFLSLLLLTSRRRSVVSQCLRHKSVFTLCSRSGLETIYIIAGRRRKVCRLGGVTAYPSDRHGKCNGDLVRCLFRRCSSQYSIVFIKAKSAPRALLFCRSYKFIPSRHVGGFFASRCSRPVCRGNVQLESVICLGERGWKTRATEVLFFSLRPRLFSIFALLAIVVISVFFNWRVSKRVINADRFFPRCRVVARDFSTVRSLWFQLLYGRRESDTFLRTHCISLRRIMASRTRVAFPTLLRMFASSMCF